MGLAHECVRVSALAVRVRGAGAGRQPGRGSTRVWNFLVNQFLSAAIRTREVSEKGCVYETVSSFCSYL